jgi:membrane-bound ClpP family serine protease
VALALPALVFAGSIFLILELDTPYSGVICVSGLPLKTAMVELGK